MAIIQASYRYQKQAKSGRLIGICEYDLMDYLAMQAHMQEAVLNKMDTYKELVPQEPLSDKPNNELWFLQHHRVFTQGTACKLSPNFSTDIPLVKSDRGGQITYHAPGQLIAYPIINLKELGLGVKSLVSMVESVVQNTLQKYGIHSHLRKGAPGVYVDNAKIAALGLKIKKGYSYHGLSLNVCMDLSPFKLIDPCGYQEMEVVNMVDFDDTIKLTDVKQTLLEQWLQHL